MSLSLALEGYAREKQEQWELPFAPCFFKRAPQIDRNYSLSSIKYIQIQFFMLPYIGNYDSHLMKDFALYACLGVSELDFWQ